MTRRIRITVDVHRPRGSVEYVDLPDGWDDLTREQQDQALEDMAMETLYTHASVGAEVVDVDGEDGEG